MATSSDRSSWLVGGTTLVGVGVGLMFVREAPLLFVASVLIGIGVGLAITALITRNK